MSEPTPREAGEGGDSGEHGGASSLVELSRLIDEIRADLRWRHELELIEAEGIAPDDATPAPSVDPALAAAIEAVAVEIAGADAPVAIESGRAIVGDVWATLRRQIHREIRISQDRQTAANRALLAALRETVGALTGLEGRLTRLDGRLTAVESRLPALAAVETNLAATARELAPLGALRVAIDDLEQRLARLERGPSDGAAS